MLFWVFLPVWIFGKKNKANTSTVKNWDVFSVSQYVFVAPMIIFDHASPPSSWQALHLLELLRQSGGPRGVDVSPRVSHEKKRNNNESWTENIHLVEQTPMSKKTLYTYRCCKLEVHNSSFFTTSKILSLWWQKELVDVELMPAYCSFLKVTVGYSRVILLTCHVE